jgi:hypothetical protein
MKAITRLVPQKSARGTAVEGGNGVGVWGQEAYYAATTGQGVNTHLKRVAVPAACRVG